ncbi:hypothetical protein BO78DRAFT_420603 [Aspergillus sclerotiicarbonarius CBS 121057]|uniref:Uncharacterized protein n=1 Tax=Aspergillus sclerotiicarbonarius (strain CBS 121057 / IBT 28362) TaxID=1448318 RepID=A0A319E4T0_ASPSB|nr:hypothetical protein BO78DRAFT_420603 [Aspergillus sclerotiicarbonarius CBS 121057]
MFDVLWLQVDENQPDIFPLLRDLRLAIYEQLAAPRLRWGREVSIASELGTCRVGILIEWKTSHSEYVLFRLDQLVDEAVIRGSGAIQRQTPSITRYHASLPMDYPCHMELLSICIPNDERHKRILHHAYHQFEL